MPQSTLDRRRLYQLGGKQRNGETLTDEESREFASLQEEAAAYGKVVADWRNQVDFKKFGPAPKRCTKMPVVSIYAFLTQCFRTEQFGCRNCLWL